MRSKQVEYRNNFFLSLGKLDHCSSHVQSFPQLKPLVHLEECQQVHDLLQGAQSVQN